MVAKNSGKWGTLHADNWLALSPLSVAPWRRGRLRWFSALSVRAGCWASHSRSWRRGRLRWFSVLSVRAGCWASHRELRKLRLEKPRKEGQEAISAISELKAHPFPFCPQDLLLGKLPGFNYFHISRTWSGIPSATTWSEESLWNWSWYSRVIKIRRIWLEITFSDSLDYYLKKIKQKGRKNLVFKKNNREKSAVTAAATKQGLIAAKKKKRYAIRSVRLARPIILLHEKINK